MTDMLTTVKRTLIGRPIASSEEHHQRLRKLIALPVFASDAISSTAYATEEILVVLVPVAGLAAFRYLVPLAFLVLVLLAIVVVSYRQTIHAYPSGGGSYIVSRENLGRLPALVAGSSLLTDYVLTVAVSVSSGVAAITSAFADLRPHRITLCLVAVALMTLANLRGLRESGSLFAPPTYLYIFSLGAMIVWGLSKTFFGDLGAIPGQEQSLEAMTGDAVLTTGASLYLLMRAFSSGAVALTGVEAVSNGVPAFRRPEARNAAATVTAMAVILGVLFFGTSVLAHHLKPIPQEGSGETVLSLMARYVFGGETPMYFLLQFSTFAILILAANTAYADFPRLSGIIAADGYLPRQLSNRGDRLVFSNGIIALALLSSLLIVVFGGDVSNLIPLYAVGVFIGFTLSQSGMVVHHWRLRQPRWKLSLAVNAVGAAATLVVLLVVAISKFAIGAWIPIVVIPLLVTGLSLIGKHYARVRAAVEIPPGWRPRRYEHNVVVLVGAMNKAVANAVTYARSLAPDRLVALSVVANPEEERALTEAWEEQEIAVPLTTLYSPYRELTQPILDYLDELDAESDHDIITVVIPEFITSISTQWLHNQTALGIKLALLYRPHTVVVSVPLHVNGPAP